MADTSEVKSIVNALKEKLTSAVTAEDFKECVVIADVDLYQKAYKIKWSDPCATMFITDTRNWANEAMNWLENRYTHEMCTSSLQEAREWAINALKSFEECMI